MDCNSFSLEDRRKFRKERKIYSAGSFREIRCMQKLWGLLAILLWTAIGRGDEPAAGQQVDQSLANPDGKAMPYLLYLPKEYGTKETNWPVMLFLHGRGESSGPLAIVKKWGPPRLVDRGEHLPYIVVSPQCPREDSWNRPTQQGLLVKLIEEVSTKYKVDKKRIYLTGLSMGGYGSWRLAADHPDLFAAVVPICGGGDAKDGAKLKDLPIWIFHGTEDTSVPLKRSQDMVDAIKEAGGTRVRFTTLEHIGHVSWEAAYTSPDLYSWLNKQVKE
jgi:predicted peptidase